MTLNVPIPKIPGGITGVDLSNSPANGRSDRSDAPAGDTSSISKNINWLNGSYAGADIKVVAHLYGKVVKDEEAASMRGEIEIADQVLLGARGFKNDVSYLSDLHLGGSYQGEVRNRFDSYLTGYGVSNPTAARIVTQRLFPIFAPIMLFGLPSRKATSGPPDPGIACEDLILEYTPIKTDLTEAYKNIENTNNEGSTTCVLENLQTLSVQTYREKNAVRSLGKSYVSGYVRGPRTIGGSMIFTMIQEHPLTKLIKAMDSASLYGETQYDLNLSSLISDQMPPIDLTIVFANEYGSISRMGIYGVEFMTDGLTLSSEDMLTEVVCQFVARDIDVPTVIGMRRLIGHGMMDFASGQSASSLAIGSRSEYNEFLNKIGMRSVFKGR